MQGYSIATKFRAVCSLEGTYSRRIREKNAISYVASLNRSASVRRTFADSKRKRILRVSRLSISLVRGSDTISKGLRFPLDTRRARINSRIVRPRGSIRIWRMLERVSELFDRFEWNELFVKLEFMMVLVPPLHTSKTISFRLSSCYFPLHACTLCILPRLNWIMNVCTWWLINVLREYV